MATNNKNKKVVTNTSSVHVVFFSCGNCGEETEHIQFCPDCGKPMRVIDVVEKFGDQADEFIKKVQDRVDKGVINPNEYVVVDEETPNIIVMGDDDNKASELDDGAITDDDDAVLVDIFPDDDEEVKTGVTKDLTDLDDLVVALDEEEDDMDIPGFGEDGIPEL